MEFVSQSFPQSIDEDSQHWAHQMLSSTHQRGPMFFIKLVRKLFFSELFRLFWFSQHFVWTLSWRDERYNVVLCCAML
jgi:hypothetical protein